MSSGSTTDLLHVLADEAAARADFFAALRHSAEALRLAPLDHRARIKVGLSLAALDQESAGSKALTIAADQLLARGFVLSSIAAIRAAVGILKTPAVVDVLERIHQAIACPVGRGRARVAPPALPVAVDESDPDSVLRLPDAELLQRAAVLASSAPETGTIAEQQTPIPLLSELSREAFLAIVEKLGYLNVPAGHIIIGQGATGSSLFILLQGEVVVSREDRGENRVLARLGPGSLFGEMALITLKPRSATVATTQPSELFELDRASIEEVAAQHPGIVDEIVSFARRRLLMNLMATSKLFAPLDEGQRLELLKSFESIIVEADRIVIEEGADSTGLYVILEGQVEVSKLDSAEDRVVLAYLRESDIFGEISLLESKPTTARVRSIEKSVLLHLRRDVFYAFAAKHPALVAYLRELSSERREETEGAMAAEGVLLDADDLILL